MLADELLDGIELVRHQAGVGVRRDEHARRGQAGCPLPRGHCLVMEEVEVVVDPDERSRVALDRPADGEEFQLGKLMFCL